MHTVAWLLTLRMEGTSRPLAATSVATNTCTLPFLKSPKMESRSACVFSPCRDAALGACGEVTVRGLQMPSVEEGCTKSPHGMGLERLPMVARPGLIMVARPWLGTAWSQIT